MRRYETVSVTPLDPDLPGVGDTVQAGQLEGKVVLLKNEFGDNWFFVVTNKEFARFYNKFGKTFTRKTFIKQFEKWSKKA
ncbi:MAG: hypothetical protein UU81_C0010G0003 [Microgenomates group bacterium GW2011_GWC1_41_8]|nr:MAG: hypothetical protein UU81_C0010G0003 [Microgenomates group bacterium GW2011_GWC1_41_8]